MSSVKPDWKLLTLKFNRALMEVLMQQYFAVQYVAMAGRYLIPQRDDDSNTSMTYDRIRQQFVGEKLIGEKRLALHPSDLTLRLTKGDNDAFHGLSLEGLTWEEAYSGIKHILADHGLSTESLRNEMHYDLPEHPLLNESRFSPGDNAHILENIHYRHNAGIILNEALSRYPKAEPVRIWPHHFDTGSLIPLSYDDKGILTSSVGVGWAIPDGMIDEPYYYLSIWTKEPLEMPVELSSPGSGHWITSQWNGSVLRLSALMKHDTAEGQHDAVVAFFRQGIQTVMEILKS